MYPLERLFQYCTETVQDLRQTYDQARSSGRATFFFGGHEWQTSNALAVVELLEARQQATKVTLCK